MEDRIFTNDSTFENTTEQKYTKAERNGKIEFIEFEVEEFDYDGFEIVRRESFSKLTYPAVILRHNSISFNTSAVKKLNANSHILIAINIEKKIMRVEPCDEDDRNSFQWYRIDKRGKIIPRTVKGDFSSQLYKDMNWNTGSTIKVLGKLLKCKGEKIFEFELVNAESYLHLSEPSADDPKRRTRVAFPEHWKNSYGESYKESKNQMVMTFEDVPEGFVQITIPKKSKQDKDNSNEKSEEETENGTV